MTRWLELKKFPEHIRQDFFVCKSYVGKYIHSKNHKYYKIITQKKLQRVWKEIRKTRKYLVVTRVKTWWSHGHPWRLKSVQGQGDLRSTKRVAITIKWNVLSLEYRSFFSFLNSKFINCSKSTKFKVLHDRVFRSLRYVDAILILLTQESRHTQSQCGTFSNMNIGKITWYCSI